MKRLHLATVIVVGGLTSQSLYAEEIKSYQDWYPQKAGYGYISGWRTHHQRNIVDVNGDGLGDIVGFANNGLYIALSTGHSFATRGKWSNFFGHQTNKWTNPQHPRYFADLDNNGCNDIIGFGEEHVRIHTMHDSNGDGLCDPAGIDTSYVFNGFVDESAITSPKFVTDYNGDGVPDLINFTSTAVEFALGDGDGTFSDVNYKLLSFRQTNTDEAAGELIWDFKDSHLVLMGDVDGDGDSDIVGFHDAGVHVALADSNDPNVFSPVPNTPVLNQLGYAAGNWRLKNNIRMLADMNVDGAADIVGFANGVTVIAYADGNGGFEPYTVVSSEFGYHDDWGHDSVRTVAHLNNDNCPDLIGIGGENSKGVVAVLSTPTGIADECEKDSLNQVVFQSAQTLSHYYSEHWNNTSHLRVVSDVNGDGLSDIIGFSSGPVRVSLNTTLTRDNPVTQIKTTSRIMY